METLLYLLPSNYSFVGLGTSNDDDFIDSCKLNKLPSALIALDCSPLPKNK